ncbi:MAG: hypothetical protein IIA75_00560 [Proteobacteria bacterium]|nr:hypothetical protein [Pseudomonadota bacterium]
MPKLGVTTLMGKSGEEYAFNVYPGDMRFNDFIPGIYYISRETGNEEVVPIYLGESDNVDVTLQNHEKQSCFDEHRYNRIAFYKNASREVRQRIVNDLMPGLETTCN